MDTKSKKFSANQAVRTIAYLLCVIMFTAGLMLTVNMIQETVNAGYVITNIEDVIEDRSYEESNDLQYRFEEKTNQILNILSDSENGAYFKNNLEQDAGFSYYATDGTDVVTNLRLAEGQGVTEADFTKQPAYLVYENGEMQAAPYGDDSRMTVAGTKTYLQSNLDGYDNDLLTVYFSFDEKFMSDKSSAYEQAKTTIRETLPLIGATMLLSLVIFIWLAVTTGAKGPEGKRRLYKVDGIWTELQLLGIVMAALLGITVANVHLYGVAVTAGSWPILIIAGTAVFILTALAVWCLLACIRLLKDGRFIKTSLIYKLCVMLCNLISEVVYGGSMMRKAMIIALAICLLSATVYLAPVVLVAILVFVPIWARQYAEIQKGVDEVKSGNLTYKIPYDESRRVTKELTELSKGINEISEASSIVVRNEIKNQRMKTELISNVSHDLRTPLTSMVSYIDLLKTEGLDSPNAPEYLSIIDQKTERLRKLTEDLFEAAKASSGAMPVNMERVDLLSLINQSLGEMSEKIETSKLEFIVNAKADKYPVTADGSLLWRVVENLLGNALKYAKEGSRVYIDIKEPKKDGKNDMVMLEIKNVSREALNIDVDELMERFTRGDESRNTDGSGLGLAITKDLVKLMGGWFEISIDGDLFKAQVLLNKAE